MEQEPITEKGGESVLACARCQGDIEHKTDDNGKVMSFAEELIRSMYGKKTKKELIDKIVELLTGYEE